MNTNIVIIGGGIGGLSAGCYLQMCGYRTRIVEMNRECGGVCAVWKRGGYVFDGATNWLVGSAPTINLHAMLNELIDMQSLELHYSDVFIRIEREGRTLSVFKDAARLREEMLRLSPGDRAPIEEFTGAIAAVRKFTIPYAKPREAFGMLDYLKFPFENRRLLLFMRKWSGISIKEFAARFRDEHLRAMFQLIFPHHEHFSMFGLIMALGWMHARSDGYPVGGSAKFTQLLEQRYRALGGVISLGERVISVLGDNGRACGVACAGGTRYEADIVVSSADSYETIFGILQGKYLDRGIIRRFGHWPVYPSLVQVSLGLGRTVVNDVDKYCLPIRDPIRMGSYTAHDMIVRFCTYDNSFAPAGKTAVVAHIRTPDYQYWCRMRDGMREKYEQEKKAVAEQVIESLEYRFGDIAACVEACDVATPATFMRFTNIYKGSYQGWAPAPGVVARLMRKTLPGLSNFYMAGQWMWPGGGLTGVIRVSRDVAYSICKNDGKKFLCTHTA